MYASEILTKPNYYQGTRYFKSPKHYLARLLNNTWASVVVKTKTKSPPVFGLRLWCSLVPQQLFLVSYNITNFACRYLSAPILLLPQAMVDV